MKKNHILVILLPTMFLCILLYIVINGAVYSLECNGESCNIVKAKGLINPKITIESTFLQSDVTNYSFTVDIHQEKKGDSYYVEHDDYTLHLHLKNGQLIDTNLSKCKSSLELKYIAKDVMDLKPVSYKIKID